MKHLRGTLQSLLIAALLIGSWQPAVAGKKSYSSGGGHSYSSSHSSSSHSSSSPSHSSSSSSSHSSGSSSHSSSSSSPSRSSSSGSSSKSFSSSGGKSYSSGSTRNDDSSHSYSSGKSYSSGSDRFSTEPRPSSGRPAASNKSRSTSGDFSFDTAAARARKEEASKETFTRFKESQSPPPVRNTTVAPATTAPSSVVVRERVYVPDAPTVSTRRSRAEVVFYPYYTQPVVRYHDPYGNLFWWWLLDRTANDRALWAYHHRHDMDEARYQALAARDLEFESRIRQLEMDQVAPDPAFVPSEIDRDLMYSDDHVQRVYTNRPTASGRAAFWIVALPAAVVAGYFFIWLVFFKRWQVNPQPTS